jgi:hypothetical protein
VVLQQAALCGVHCLNTLLQGPYFSEVDLGQISQDLDAEEQKMMAEGGLDGDDYKKFIAEGSHNAAADGMFSVQVCAHTSFDGRSCRMFGTRWSWAEMYAVPELGW